MRAFGGLVAGILIGFVVAIAFILVSFGIHPLPPGFNPKSAAALGDYYMASPFLALAVIVLGLFLGGLLGGWAANAIAGRRWPAWVVGVVLSIYMLSEMLLVPHPLWMEISGVLAPLVGAAIAHHLSGRRPYEDDAQEEDAARDEVHEL